jgi:hypothetical protein
MDQPKRRLSQSCEVTKKQKLEAAKDLVPRSCKLFRPQPGEVHEEILGCTVLAATLRMQIAEPLANAGRYEIEAGGRGIVTRFLHWNGCRRNSGSSYLRKFCNDHSINLFQLSKPELFDPSTDLTEVFHLARRMQPAVVYIYGLDNFLLTGQENAKTISVLSRECKKIYSNRYAVWVVLRTNLCNFEAHNPLHWDFYEYFLNNYQPLPLQTDADVAVILKHRLAYYLPEVSFPGEEIVAFANAYARHCTYHQINEFIRKVITDARRKLSDNDRLATPNPAISLVTLSQAVCLVLTPKKNTVSSITPHWPTHTNFDQFIKL